MFGVPITLLQSHLYGITQSKIKKQGKNVAKKGKGICAICETMKVIKHSITHTIKTKSCQDTQVKGKHLPRMAFQGEVGSNGSRNTIPIYW